MIHKDCTHKFSLRSVRNIVLACVHQTSKFYGMSKEMSPTVYQDQNLKHEVKWSDVKLLSRVQLFATPWTVAHQAPWPMGFSRHEYWSGLPFTSAGNLPDPGRPLSIITYLIIMLIRIRKIKQALVVPGSTLLLYYIK